MNLAHAHDDRVYIYIYIVIIIRGLNVHHNMLLYYI